MWQIEFTTAAFRPYLPEARQVNPGVYGFELAHWLSVELMKRGVATSYPLGEDWGWFVAYAEGGLHLMICCASQAEEGAGYTGAPVPWTVHIEARRRLFGNPKEADVAAAVERLSRPLLEALEEAGIDVRRVDA